MDPVLLPWLPQAPAALPVVATVTEWNLVAAHGIAAANRSPSFWQAGVFALWAGGLVVMGWSTLRDWRRTRELLGNSVRCTDEQVLNAVAQAANARGLRRVPQLRVSQRIDSPLVMGHFRPVLLLPDQESMSSAELEMAVVHELEHLRRADLWCGFIPALARHCFFFHPLVHLAVREYGIAREAACDVAVVDAAHRSRRDYGELLLRLGTADARGGLAAVSPTFHALRRRLALLQQPSFLPRVGSIAVLLVAVAGVMPLRLVAAVAKPAVVPGIAVPAIVVPASDVTEPVAQPVAVGKPDVSPAANDKSAIVKPRQPAPVRVAAPASPSATAPASPAQVPGSRPSIAASRSLGEEGVVRLRICYDEKGMVNESTVAESSGFTRLDEAAVRMGRRVRINPGRVGGNPKAGCLVLPVRFSATGQAAQAAQAVPYTGERMSVNFQYVDTRTLLQLIGNTSGRTIVLDKSVTGSITINVTNVPWDQLLDIVLSTKGLEKRVEGDAIVITAADGSTSSR
jgi:TonB family protein